MFAINDFLDALLLGGFLFGVIFTVASFALGFADIGLHHDHGGGPGSDSGDFLHGLFNVTAILAFVTWFGGLGYLFRTALEWNTVLSLLLGGAGGFAAAVAIGLFVTRFLRSGESELDPADYNEVGIVARVTSGIRAGGFGEIVYEMGGTRQVASAKANTAQAIGFGTEVVVLRIDKGVAVVEPFADLLGESTL